MDKTGLILALRTHIIQSLGMAKDVSSKWKPTRAEVTVFVSKEMDFKSEMVTKGKNSHYMIKISIIQGAFIVINRLQHNNSRKL